MIRIRGGSFADDVTLGPGGTERVEGAIELGGPGEYTVGIRGEESVIVAVEGSAIDAGPTGGGGQSGEPSTLAVCKGLDALAGVAALITAIGLGARRRR